MPEATPASGVPAATSMTAYRARRSPCRWPRAAPSARRCSSPSPHERANGRPTSPGPAERASARAGTQVLAATPLCARGDHLPRDRQPWTMTDARARAVISVVPTTADGERTHAGVHHGRRSGEPADDHDESQGGEIRPLARTTRSTSAADRSRGRTQESSRGRRRCHADRRARSPDRTCSPCSRLFAG